MQVCVIGYFNDYYLCHTTQYFWISVITILLDRLISGGSLLLAHCGICLISNIHVIKKKTREQLQEGE